MALDELSGNPETGGSRQPATDSELIEEFRQGKVEGFNELVRRYRQKVYWVARRVMGAHDDADDVVQEVFVRVYRGLKRFRGEANVYTWMYRITVNVSLNALRAKRIRDFVHYDDVVERPDDGGESADSGLLREEYKTILERAIERLPAKQKMVFILRYYDEMDYEKMSKVLKKSVGGLKANYFHAVKKIQEYVRKEMKS